MASVVAMLAPEIQSEVGHALRRVTQNQQRDPRQEIFDLVQEVLERLLARDGKILRAWDPERGSLPRFVRVVTRRHVIGVIRSKRRNPYSERPTPSESFDQHRSSAPELDRRVDARDHLDHVLDHLRVRLDERGWRLFQMLYIEERDIDYVCTVTQMTRNAVYAWRARLKRLLEQLVAEPEGV